MIRNRETSPNVPIQLYNQFSETTKRTVRAFIPVGVATAANIAAFIGVNSASDEIIRGQYYVSGIAIGAVAEVISAIWSMRKYERRSKTLQDIAMQIAQAEGRNPQDPKAEVEQTGKIIILRTLLTPNVSLPRLPQSQIGRSIAGDAIERSKNFLFFAFDKQSSQYEKDKAVRGEIRTTALALSEHDWDMFAQDSKQPENKRRLAFLMRGQIRRRLSQIQKEKSPQ